jgi:ParB family chromosome partitioning protein
MQPIGDSRITSLENHISELQAEIARLKSENATTSEQEAKIQELTMQLSQQSGEHLIDVTLIDPDPHQPRTIFPKEVVLARAKSLREEGQLVPIIVTPLGDRYLLFEGNIRWLAAPHAGLTHLRAVLLPAEERTNSIEIFDKQLTTSIQSEKLHDYDLAKALIRLIVERSPDLKGREAEIPGLLNAAIMRLKRSGRLSELSALKAASRAEQVAWVEAAEEVREEERPILLTILGKSLHPTSINNVAFKLLKVPADLVDLLKEGVESRKVIELSRLTAGALGCTEREAVKLRKKIAQRVLHDGLDRGETTALVNETLESRNPSTEDGDTNEDAPHDPRRYVQRLQKITKSARKADWSNPRLQQLLEEIESLLGTESE